MKCRTAASAITALLYLLAPLAAAQVSPDVQAALDRISADSLRGHVSFLASDLLQGRDTPSPGLDVAAEYIASQFRRAGLESDGDDGYFETAAFVQLRPNLDGFEFVFESGGSAVRVPKEKVLAPAVRSALELSRVPVLKGGPGDVAKWTPEQAQGKVILTEMPDFGSLDEEGRRKEFETFRAFRAALPRLKPALVITLMRRGAPPASVRPRLVDASEPEAPAVQVSDPELLKAYDAMKAGPADATVTYRQAAASEQPVTLRNVIGVLRGSDPVLKDTYVLVTAHYDHVGVLPGSGSDTIYNGANDDASGTASVVELASALAKLRDRPKRSIVFMAYFGEEKGLLGSRYYGRHPVVPLEKTVADINLEQLGRTDADEGQQVARASLTGFDYSDIGETFRKAGELTGVAVFNSEKYSDAYFSRSDNQALADLGIPAHTLCVAYSYPDYHRPGDKWQKLDYANMEKVDRMIALGVLMIAGNPEPPKWNEANPKAARYVRAWKQRMGR